MLRLVVTSIIVGGMAMAGGAIAADDGSTAKKSVGPRDLPSYGTTGYHPGATAPKEAFGNPPENPDVVEGPRDKKTYGTTGFKPDK